MYKRGDVIDDLTVLSYEGQTKNFVKLFKVRCNVCGTEKVIQYAKLNAHSEKLDKDLQLTLEESKRLKKENKKMKCCMNCQNCGLTEDNVLECFEEHEINSYPCEYWELTE